MHISTKKEQEGIAEEVNKHVEIRKKIKKHRKPKLPQNVEFDPKFKPDPERWLPKWQRKGYKKRGKKNIGGRTQGSSNIGK